MTKWFFRGQQVSSLGVENGFVDYAALTAGLQLVYVSELIFEKLDFELESGEIFDEDDNFIMFSQYFITNGYGAEILAMNNETVWYCDELNLYLWGVVHGGTGWSCVLTQIPLEAECVKVVTE